MTQVARITIPEDLLEQIERGNTLLFVGERLVRDSAGTSVVDRLIEELAARLNGAEDSQRSFPELAQEYAQAHGRAALVQFIRDQLALLGDEPQEAHQLIARLAQCHVLVTTALNGRLERAFREAGRPLQVVISTNSLPFTEAHNATLFKLRGSLDQPETLILTEHDHERFFRERASISKALQGQLAQKTILFIGYDLSDPYFKQLYNEAIAPLDVYARPSYAFAETPRTVRSWCSGYHIEVLEFSSSDFLRELTARLQARQVPDGPSSLLRAPSLALQLPAHPYKKLDYYESQDATLFFGREEEISQLINSIHAHRLTIIYGASGVGKTSLLLAGVAPQLEQGSPAYTTLLVRLVDEPLRAIRNALRQRLKTVTLPDSLSLFDLVAAATQLLNRPLVLILDQFEEFFIRHSREVQAAFTDELLTLCEARELPIKLILSLREDWLAEMSEIERHIPGILNNHFRLRLLERAQAQTAIVSPAAQFSVTYEPELIEQLLNDLSGEAGIVNPPQLQLVCSALYDQRGNGIQQITLASYQQVGGVREVLRRYLQDELEQLPAPERVLARGILAELVTSQNTKAVKTIAELARAVRTAPSDIESVLEKLVRARLLRVPNIEREDGARSYELVHEYLIAQIEQDPDLRARKQAEELVRQGVENWQQFNVLIPGNVLSLVAPRYRELRLSTFEQHILDQSIAQHNRRVRGEYFWIYALVGVACGGIGAVLGLLASAGLFVQVRELMEDKQWANVLQPVFGVGLISGASIGCSIGLGRLLGGARRDVNFLVNAILGVLIGMTGFVPNVLVHGLQQGVLVLSISAWLTLNRWQRLGVRIVFGVLIGLVTRLLYDYFGGTLRFPLTAIQVTSFMVANSIMVVGLGIVTDAFVRSSISVPTKEDLA